MAWVPPAPRGGPPCTKRLPPMGAPIHRGPPQSPSVPPVPLGTPAHAPPPPPPQVHGYPQCHWGPPQPGPHHACGCPSAPGPPPPSPRVWGDTPPTPAGLGSGGADHAPLPKTTPTAGRCSRSSRGERPLGGAFSRCRSVPHSFVPPASFPGGAEASGTVRGGRRRFGGNWVGTAGENRVPGLGGLGGGGGSGEVEVAGPGVLGV